MPAPRLPVVHSFTPGHPSFQVQNMLKRVTTAGKKEARVSDDRRSFIEANLVAMAPSPAKEGVIIPGLSARARAMTGLKFSTAKRLLVAAMKKRKKLSAHEEGIAWSSVIIIIIITIIILVIYFDHSIRKNI